MVVDGFGAEVGTIELSSGMVTRRFGDDVVLLSVTPHGFVQAEIAFFHTTTDCSGDRYLQNNGGSLAYFGQLSGETVFYTTLSDPSWTPLAETLNSYELVKFGADPMTMGECVASAMGNQSVGKATAATDLEIDALAPPFRLK